MSDSYLDKFVEGSDNPVPEGDGAGEATIRDRAISVLKEIYDPEIPVNIYELGLIYGVDTDEEAGKIDVTMTLTTPMCPVADSMPGEIEEKLRAIEAVNDVSVDLVWDPPWDMSLLSDAAKLELGML
jgi:FeS assembly SUF system protein